MKSLGSHADSNQALAGPVNLNFRENALLETFGGGTTSISCANFRSLPVWEIEGFNPLSFSTFEFHYQIRIGNSS